MKYVYTDEVNESIKDWEITAWLAGWLAVNHPKG